MMQLASEAFRTTVSETTVLAYEIGLADLSPAEIEQAFYRAIRAQKFMPAVSELRELCGQLPENHPVARFIADGDRAVAAAKQRALESPAVPCERLSPAAALRQIAHDYRANTRENVLAQIERIRQEDEKP